MANWLSKIFSGGKEKKEGVNSPLQQQERMLRKEESKWARGQTFLDDYLIEKELGRGGMGRVWLVKSRSTGRLFAVKQAIIQNEAHRRAFLAELQTWIDLPEHPNIAPCRFFRTVGDEIVIFADFIEGGSLADWIAKRKLGSLEQILDVAIQFAWGLHTIHENGLIHQDVKPGNVLMTQDGVPMLTDFGLARARMHTHNRSLVSPPGEQSVLVSFGGMTPAYASPEQRAGQPLSRKTDIWSWGVSVLDMFMGGVSCPHGGHIAAEVLESFNELGRTEGLIIKMRPQATEVLRKCFAHLPKERWKTILEPLVVLTSEYELTVGRHYPRRMPYRDYTLNSELVNLSEKIERWTNPRGILNAIRHISNPQEVSSWKPSSPTTEPGSAVEDMAIFEEAQYQLEHLISSGGKGLEIYLAELCIQRSAVHRFLGDVSEALQLIERAIQILQPVVEKTDDTDHLHQLASAYNSKISTLGHAARFESAPPVCKQAIDLWRRIVVEKGKLELAHQLTAALTNAACVHIKLHNLQEAAYLCDSAIKVAEIVSEKLRKPDINVEKALAHAYTNKGIVLAHMKEEKRAVSILDRGIAIRENLVSEQRCCDVIPHLAASYIDKAIVLHTVGQHWEAAVLCDKAVNLIKGNIPSFSTADSSERLATALAVKAGVVASMGQPLQSISLYDEAIAIRERLVSMDGKQHLAEDLYRLKFQRDKILAQAGTEICADTKDQ